MKQSNKLRPLGVGFLLLLLASVAPAQIPLTLSEALLATLENNFDIRVEETRSAIARNNNSWEAAGRYPSVSFSVANANRLSNIDNPASFLNGQFSNLSVTGTVDVNWNIFSGFAVKITKDRLAELERQSNGNVVLIVENSLQAVILQYNDCLVKREQLRVLKSNLDLSRDRLDYVRSKQEIGTGTTFELLNLQTAYQSDSSALLLQQLAVDNAYRSLGQLIGFPPDSSLVLEDELQTEFKRYDLSLLRSKMFSNNLNLRNQFINLAVLQKDVELARAQKYPSIGLNLGSSYTSSRFQLEDLDPAGGNQLDYYANFSLNFTLYNGGTIRRNLQNAEINERVTEMSIDQMQQDMDYQLVNALELYDVRRQLLGLSDATLDVAQRNLDIAEEKFKNGTLSSFDYRDVQVAYLNAAFARVQALYNLAEAETSILRLIGGIVDMVERG